MQATDDPPDGLASEHASDHGRRGLRRSLGRDRRGTFVALACGILAASFAAYPLTFPHMLAGVHGYASGAGYDDGVYLTVALRLVHGDLPYRDFAFVHPPGIALLLAPLAALDSWVDTREILVLARIATVAVVALNTVVVTRIVRHHGIAASLTGGVLLAGFPGAYNADHTILLEPWLVLPCLLAFLALFPDGRLTSSPRRLLVAGLLGGFAGTVKVWAILVVLPLLVVCLVLRPRRGFTFLAGLVAGFVVPCLPFVVVASEAFARDVLIAQAARSSAGERLDAATRLGIMSGLKHFGEPALTLPIVILAASLAASVAAVLLLGRRQARAADWSAAAVVGIVVLGLFLPGQFYDHYAYFSAAFIAVLVAVSAGLVSTAALRGAKTYWPARLAQATIAGMAPLVACSAVIFALPLGLGGARDYFADASDPGEIIEITIPAGACVVFDDPVLLLVGNRLGSPTGECPRLVDPFGLWLTEADGSLPHLGGPYVQTFVDEWSRWLARADYVVLSVPGSSYLPFSPELIGQFNATYRLVGARDHAYIYEHIR